MKQYSFKLSTHTHTRNDLCKRTEARKRLRAKYEANTTFVSGIICRKCNTTLPPHLMCDHLNVEFMENFHRCE